MPTDKQWIQTYTGKKFWPLAPLEQDIDIVDIAHALSMQCRFAGHVKDFYSVAQHSVLVSERLPRNMALWGLLHDASEAYLSDVVSPVKHAAGLWTYRKAERRLEKLIAHKYGLEWPIPTAVKRADNLMLLVEAHSLKSPPINEWGFPDAPLVTENKIETWSWRRAKAEFLLTFASLREPYSVGDKHEEINVGENSTFPGVPLGPMHPDFLLPVGPTGVRWVG